MRVVNQEELVMDLVAKATQIQSLITSILVPELEKTQVRSFPVFYLILV